MAHMTGPAAGTHRGSPLADHVGGGLVVAQAEEARMAQPAGAGPLGEADLRDELRGGPRDAALLDRRRVGERRVVAAQRAQPFAEIAQRLMVEAGADLARVAQRAAVVVPEEERAELRPRAARRGVAPDHELLPLLALHLQPVARAPVGVGAVRALGDEALPPLAARLGEQRLAGLAAVRREAHAAGERQLRAQQALARQERQRADVAAVEPEDVEDVEEHGDAPVPALREPGEAGLPAVEGDDLAVDREALARLARERVDELGVAPVERQVVAREQPDGATVAHGDAANAVELALEDPLGVAEALARQRRLHRGLAGRRRAGP